MRRPLIGWAATARAVVALEERVDILEGRPRADGRWKVIDEAPRYLEPGDVPVEFILLLYDPRNEITYRVQMGFWNQSIEDWQSCDEMGHLHAPTHFMPLPLPPEQFA